MPHHNKIATCCYCGARSVLRLTARDGHELACGSCGAPLHEMKPIKLQPKRGQDRDVKPSRPAPAARRIGSLMRNTDAPKRRSAARLSGARPWKRPSR